MRPLSRPLTQPQGRFIFSVFFSQLVPTVFTVPSARELSQPHSTELWWHWLKLGVARYSKSPHGFARERRRAILMLPRFSSVPPASGERRDRPVWSCGSPSLSRMTIFWMRVGRSRNTTVNNLSTFQNWSWVHARLPRPRAAYIKLKSPNKIAKLFLAMKATIVLFVVFVLLFNTN